MSILNAIFETEDFGNYIHEHQDVFLEAEELVQDFSKVIKSFILSNPSEFLAESVEQMQKNIRVFTEVATAQYIQEISSMAGNVISERYNQQAIHEGSYSTGSSSDYL